MHTVFGAPCTLHLATAPHTTPAAYCTIRVFSGKGLGGREGGGGESSMLCHISIAQVPTKRHSRRIQRLRLGPGGCGGLLRSSSRVKRSVSFRLFTNVSL